MLPQGRREILLLNFHETDNDCFWPNEFVAADMAKYSFVTVSAKEVMPIFTRIKRDDGWKHLQELRGQSDGQMYEINPEIISRFLIKPPWQSYRLKEPTSKVQQFAQADLREIRV